MKQTEFLNALRVELERHRVLNIDEILSDYREHFEHGIRSCKSEEEISQKLGSPSTIAKAYETDSWITRTKSQESTVQFSTLLKALGRFLLIAPFNFLVLFIPGVILFSLLFSGWAVALAFVAVVIAILGVATKVSIVAFGVWAVLALVSGALGILGLAALAAMIMYIVTKFVFIAVLNYIQWNIRFIMENKDRAHEIK